MSSKQILLNDVLTYHWQDSFSIRDKFIAVRMKRKWFWTPDIWIEASMSAGLVHAWMHTFEGRGLVERREVPLTLDELTKRMEQNPDLQFTTKYEWRLKPRGSGRRNPRFVGKWVTP